MAYEGLVLTGTRAAGKTTVATKLVQQYDKYKLVKAITTRQPRPDDPDGQYEYLSPDDFQAQQQSSNFVTEVTYAENHYAIPEDNIDQVTDADYTPLAIIAPETVNQFRNWAGDASSWFNLRFMYVFIDADDDELARRLAQRKGASADVEADRRHSDRDYIDQCLYTCKNHDLESTVQLIHQLDQLEGRSGVITGRILKYMLACDMTLEEASPDYIEGASYDLRLGDEYYRAGDVKHLSETDPLLEIQPYDYAIVTSRERANLPRNVCGRFGLAVSLFCQGIILSNGPQVDPGFRGPLFCLLFNTSNSPVVLSRGEHYATLELSMTLEPTDKYQGKYKGRKLGYYLPNSATRGAVRELKEDVERVERESRHLQNRLYAVLSIILALVALFVAFG